MFEQVDDRLRPIDAESESMPKKYEGLLNDVRQQPMREFGWTGNVVQGPVEAARVRFFASYPFGRLLLVISKAVLLAPSSDEVESPFDKRFLDAVAASVIAIVGQIPEQPTGADKRAGSGPKTVVFEELKHWGECKELWRKRYGVDRWLAIRGGQVVADAASSSELDQKIATMKIEPPILYVPPDGHDVGDEVFCGSDEPPTIAIKRQKGDDQ